MHELNPPAPFSCKQKKGERTLIALFVKQLPFIKNLLQFNKKYSTCQKEITFGELVQPGWTRFLIHPPSSDSFGMTVHFLMQGEEAAIRKV